MKYLIIGGNAAGMSFAAKYKRNSPEDEVIVIEKRDYVSFGGCGLPYFTAGLFHDTDRMISRSPEQAIKSGLDMRVNSEVISIDKENKSVLIKCGEESYQQSYDKLLICTGARPIVPNFGQYNPEHVYTLTSKKDGFDVKNAFENPALKNVCIIGAGFIGLEVFDAAHHLNKNVTIIERETHIMSRQFSPEMINTVEQDIRANGGTLKTSCSVESISDNAEGGYIINTTDGEIRADIIILSLGFKPNTEAFDLPKLPNGSLMVNKVGQTDDEHISAVGDCAASYHIALDKMVYLPLATTANKQARMMADHVAGKETFLQGMLGSSCLKVLDQELACTGISEIVAKENNISYKTSIIEDQNQTDYYPGQEPIKIKLVYDPASKQLLGGEIIGKKGAVSRINALAVAITAKMTTSQLGYLDFCYAPPFSRTWDALNVAGNVAK
ncbi:CoA-disulfide reductase [Psychromonas aquimarina]|uniref:CoA-disulfide reductase n=1 Tax=Psychromonas aquimarina TaxID=444919 RepID=UPI0004233F0E|nr:CoA-disulfide reductase [Psychromonas aquimarina]